jgi:hypothetical protein
VPLWITTSYSISLLNFEAITLPLHSSESHLGEPKDMLMNSPILLIRELDSAFLNDMHRDWVIGALTEPSSSPRSVPLPAFHEAPRVIQCLAFPMRKDLFEGEIYEFYAKDLRYTISFPMQFSGILLPIVDPMRLIRGLEYSDTLALFRQVAPSQQRSLWMCRDAFNRVINKSIIIICIRQVANGLPLNEILGDAILATHRVVEFYPDDPESFVRNLRSTMNTEGMLE